MKQILGRKGNLYLSHNATFLSQDTRKLQAKIQMIQIRITIQRRVNIINHNKLNW